MKLKFFVLYIFILIITINRLPIASAEIINLNSDLSNINQFIDGLFSDDVRNFDNYKENIFTQKKDRFFFSPTDMQVMLSLFNNVWTNSAADSKCPETDKKLLRFLKWYIQKNNLVMHKPQIDFDSINDQGIPIYKIHKYEKFDIIKDSQGIREFLELFLAGAHFVVIDGSQDSIGIESFFNSFSNDRTIGSLLSRNLMNSHYTRTINLGSRNYLSINADKAPIASPFICSFIMGKTASYKANTFFQLEGWPTSIFHHQRHSTDYLTHRRSKWNISTYGACAYSEKRATAIFLAKADWNSNLTSDTIMPHYRGADTPQPWLEKDLINFQP
ncbi:MAG: hypothetical protein HQK51_10010 [Oligoflexia bacterium]|nr:hypothetical protein [Oligoflexia bacterium]